ncbi:hypothetical protein GGR42_003191 [Saonia flava]|uniref:Uncharacterized protein n=1 Tax=Saonia flava TaxID=523696 RepID=A0A846R0L5_9FLAO|nr:hypothetical protein [Saonia flava]NJB72700.1 hypothetical protein [Saonia flava]
MTLLYQNKYGAAYMLNNAPNPNCKIQLIIDTIGLFMCKEDLQNLLGIVQRSYEPCYCNDCGGKACNKIWCANPLVDICLKVNEPTLDLLEDLIKGTQFMLNIDETLDEHRLRTGE